MPVTTTTIRIRTSLADEAMKVLGAKSRTEAVRMVLREIVAMKRFNAPMKKNSGKSKAQGTGRVMSSYASVSTRQIAR